MELLKPKQVVVVVVVVVVAVVVVVIGEALGISFFRVVVTRFRASIWAGVEVPRSANVRKSETSKVPSHQQSRPEVQGPRKNQASATEAESFSEVQWSWPTARSESEENLTFL